MAITKYGSPEQINIVKQSAFQIDLNVLASVLKDKYPENKLSINELHDVLKTLGITEYKSEDMTELIGRLNAIGISVTENA